MERRKFGLPVAGRVWEMDLQPGRYGSSGLTLTWRPGEKEQ